MNLENSSLTTPISLRHHRLVRHRHFYTLPAKVLEAVVNAIGENTFDAELLGIERQLSRICGDHSQNVGFWCDAVIPYAELFTTVVPDVDADCARSAGLDPAMIDRDLQVHRERNVPILDRFTRAYCGWLMTNREFLDEHDALVNNHAATVLRWGMRKSRTPLPDAIRAEMIPGTDPTEDPKWIEFADERERFCDRWRLAGLAGPNLPVPRKPMTAGMLLKTDIDHLMDTGGLMYLPDTMPIPSRDQLRGMLEDSLHGGQSPSHLSEWMDIIRSDNMAKNRMDPFARLFELQHFWRLLQHRHPDAVKRKTGKLETAFANVLGVNPQLIHKDLVEIRKKLGNDWLDRTSPL